MKLTISVKSGGTTKTYELDQTLCVIGRKDADIVLNDRRCSRNHAVLYESEDGELRVKDLNSSNGTLLNSQTVTEMAVSTGDTLKIGDCELVIEEFSANSSMTFVGNVKDILKKPIPSEETYKGNPYEDLNKKKKAG